MNDRNLEDTRMPEDEVEEFECALCEAVVPYFGSEVVINEKRICNGCAFEVADQAGYWSRLLKAERKVKELQGTLEIAKSLFSGIME